MPGPTCSARTVAATLPLLAALDRPLDQRRQPRVGGKGARRPPALRSASPCCCPKASIYGRVKAWTPLLDEPLQGPVYLRSSNNELPDLVLVLRGIVDIEASARIDSARGRIRTSFGGVPDAPLSRVVLNMQGGKKGLIQNSTHLCRGKQRANAAYAAQNGRQAKGRPVVRAAGCKKGKRKAKAKRSGHRRS